ncbi:sure-like protein [Mollisia scopiformis]|uniref:Sure-like protein n=1 Tax=Mollisia scopiformis TaxID=149040 RepID=A0A194X761_MOLSC|nr:sure-like protein [Mollisia scopiformis]KUJ16008.1 sure-like protein [Mollisia scopiformis]
MRLAKFYAALAAIANLFQINALNILITNDDGFGVSNIRELYKAVKALGHNAYIVASASDKSGTGGSLSFATTANLTADTQYGIVKAGAPSVGADPNDSHIWYYNGTPSVCVMVALDYILSTFANFSTPDLVLSGPNYGDNLGDFAYTGSGTIGATYFSIGRGIPAIAFSANYPTTTPYYEVNTTTKAGLKDPATIAAELAANLVQSLVAKANGSRILPLGYGLNVNMPYITSFDNSSCVDPPLIHTRLTGDAWSYGVKFNASTGLFTAGLKVGNDATGINVCINGDCTLIGETALIAKGCYSSVSVFTVDYDAPNFGNNVVDETKLLGALVQNLNSTSLIGGLNATATAGRNASVTTPTATSSVITNDASAARWTRYSGTAASLWLVIGVFLLCSF